MSFQKVFLVGPLLHTRKELRRNSTVTLCCHLSRSCQVINEIIDTVLEHTNTLKADRSESCSHFVVFTWLRRCELVIISTHFWVDQRATFTTAPPRGLLTVRHPKKGGCWEGRGELTTQELKTTEKREMQWLGTIKKKHCS